MISSPTEKGIVIIGGLTTKGVTANRIVSYNFVELSGNIGMEDFTAKATISKVWPCLIFYF